MFVLYFDWLDYFSGVCILKLKLNMVKLAGVHILWSVLPGAMGDMGEKGMNGTKGENGTKGDRGSFTGDRGENGTSVPCLQSVARDQFAVASFTCTYSYVCTYTAHFHAVII